MTALLTCPPFVWAKSGPYINVPHLLIFVESTAYYLLSELVMHVWEGSGFPGYLLILSQGSKWGFTKN